MKVKELRELLSRHNELRDDEEVSVLLDVPSIGPSAHTKVKSANFGFDWNKGLQFKTEARIAPKTEKQDVFEAAYSLLAWLATKPVKKDSYEIGAAKLIMKKYGWTDEKFERVRSIYHREAAK